MLVIAVVGVVLDWLLVGLLWVFVFATLFQFGRPRLRWWRSCPACKREGLEELKEVVSFDQLSVYRCFYCRGAFREGYDGRLEAIPC